jgi:hypothetical protein
MANGTCVGWDDFNSAIAAAEKFEKLANAVVASMGKFRVYGNIVIIDLRDACTHHMGTIHSMEHSE